MRENQSDFFYRLTPDEIIDAVIKLGLEPSGHVSQLNSMENRVFDLRLENGRHVVTKFYRPGRWVRAQIEEEHAFLFDLQANDIAVLAPQRFGGESLFEEQGIYFAIWPRTGGREPDDLGEIDLQILGRLIARMHNVGAARAYNERPHFTAQRFVYDPVTMLREKKFLPPKYQSTYEELAGIVAQSYAKYSEDVPVFPIHGDLHKGNILNGAEGWFLLDFDDSLTGPAVQDIWMLFPGSSASAQSAREIFLNAYREFRDFDERWLHLSEVLRAMRIIHYSGWIARRYDDPAFTAAFPSFADDAYWEEEINILRSICAEFDGAAATADTSENLTNKDFFFDMND